MSNKELPEPAASKFAAEILLRQAHRFTTDVLAQYSGKLGEQAQNELEDITVKLGKLLRTL